jgi:LEA14-like dessication related protein
VRRLLKITGLSLLAIIIAFAAWVFFFPKKALAYVVPQVKQINDVRIKVKDNVADVYTRLVARNKSFLTISIDSLKYSIILSDKISFRNNKYVGLKLGPYDEDTIDFPITKIPYKDIFRNFRSELKKGDSTSYELNLKIQYSTFFGTLELPISKSANFKIPRTPELKIVDVKYSNFRLKQLNADLKIKVINHGDFSITVSNIKYNLYIDQQGRAGGGYPRKIDINPKSFTTVNFPVKINMKHIGKTLMDVIRNNDNYNYSLVVDANVKSLDAQDQPCHVNLVKYGRLELKK